MRRLWPLLLLLIAVSSVRADEGMWLLNELNKQNLERMKELGFNLPYDSLHSEEQASLSQAVVIFGGGCTGIAVSEEGLIFTNHHCGFGSIQSLSSVEHDYLKDGFVSQTKEAELPVPGLSVKFLKKTINVTDRIMAVIDTITDEVARIQAADSISNVLCDSVGN
jgi:hypothetical protein